MQKTVLSLLIAFVGVVLVAFGQFWPQGGNSEKFWTDEQQQRLTQAVQKVQQATEAEAIDPQKPGAAETVATARKEYQALQLEFDAARQSASIVPRVCFWLGLLLAVGGLVICKSG